MAVTIKSHSTHAASGAQPRDDAPVPAQPAVDVIALTTRDDFLLELGQCLEGMASISPVETSALALAAAASSRRVQVLVVDSREFTNLRAEVDLLHAHAPALTVLAFAELDVEGEVAAALKGSSAFAVLPLPIDARKTAAVFEGAAADAQARRVAVRAAGPAVAEPKAPAAAESRRAAGPAGRVTASAGAAAAAPELPSRQDSAGGGKTRNFVLAGVACLVVAAAAAWFLTREDAPVPAAAPPISAGAESVPAAPPVAAVPTVQGDVDELLEKARVAMRERRYAEPANNSALLYYRSAAEADPGNAEALDGLGRLRPIIVARFDELTKAGRHDAAAAALAQLQGALPDDPAIAGLRLRLASARVAQAVDDGDPERAAALVRSAQAVGTVPDAQLARWRADISRLNDQTKQEQLAERQARDAAVAQQKSRDARASAAAREAQAVRERENAQKLEAQRTEQLALAAAKAAEAEAAAQASAVQRVEPRLKRNVRPEFPADALEKGISGVVTVAYTVDVEGRTQDIRVESSEPPGIFDQAAINAVRRWRYEPATANGVPTESRLRLAIRFSQPK